MGDDQKNGGVKDGHCPSVALTVTEAAEASRTSRSTIYEALQRRELEGKKLGRRTLILRAALEQYLSSLPAFGAVNGGEGSNNG